MTSALPTPRATRSPNEPSLPMGLDGSRLPHYRRPTTAETAWPRSPIGHRRVCATVPWMIPDTRARLQFREMTASDLDIMTTLLGDPAVMAFYPAAKSQSEVTRWIEWNQHNYAEHGYGLWIIETHEGEFVGDCGLTWQQVNGRPMLEVGYHVCADHQGKGYASEAAAACRDFARDELHASQLVAIIHPDNVASRRVAEKIGMQHLEDDHNGSIPLRTVLGMSL